MYFPIGMMKVTVGCQMEILMLIEMLEKEGISVVSGNTDGVVSLFPSHMEETYNKVCKEWEKKVGNDKIVEGSQMGALEFVDFEYLWQESINHYIGKKLDGGVKKKGRFMTEFDLHKNKSKRIIPLALEAYFIHGKDPVEFIRNHKNIFDFCIGRKASRDMYYEEQWIENDKVVTKQHKKLVRYYVSKKGTVLYKRGFDFEGKPVDGHCEAPNKNFTWIKQPTVTYFNKAFKVDSFEEYDVDYDYYILQTLERIDKIEKTKKAISFADKFKPQKQTSLF